MSHRLIGRFLQLGSTEEIYSRRAELIAVGEESSNQKIGRPVPVVFGTRTITPTVTAWGGLSKGNTKLVEAVKRWFLYDAFGNPGPPQYVRAPSTSVPRELYQAAWELSLRMVLCVGPIDNLNRIFIDNIEIFPWGSSITDVITPVLTGNEPTRYADPEAYERFFTSLADLYLFGGLEGDGGIGLGYNFQTVGRGYQFGSEFLLCSGNDRPASTDGSRTYTPLSIYAEGLPAELAINTSDRATARGCSSLLFYDFNFGSTLPLKPWRVEVSRIDQQTDYTPQWYPDKSVVSASQARGGDQFYLFCIPLFNSSNQDRRYTGWDVREFRVFMGALRHFVQFLPNDGSVTIQILGLHMSYYGRFPQENIMRFFSPSIYNLSSWKVVEPTFIVNIDSEAKRDSVLAKIDSLNRADWPVPTRNPVRVVNYLIEEMAKAWQTRRNFQRVNRRKELSTIVSWWGGLQLISTRDDSAVSVSILNDWLDVAVQQFIDLASQTGEDGRRPTIRWFVGEGSTAFSRVTYPPSPGAGQNYPVWTPRISSFGGVGGITYFSHDEFLPSLIFRERIQRSLHNRVLTMNPVHALRETLINRDWGSGVSEAVLDDASFRAAADTCREERLDFCYVWDSPGPTDRLVESILEYIDGLLYYEPNSGLYKLKLIRNDYDIDTIPRFNNSNISDLTMFKRQHADRIINSLTVSYFDAVRDVADSLTIHDLARVEAAGKTIAAKFNYPGCATKEAALVVAAREFFSLSQAVVSFVISVDNADGIGLGDPVRVSWRDLNLAQIVMRVMSIDYSDGRQTEAAGVKLTLIQDVFSTVIPGFDDAQGPNPRPPVIDNPLPDLGSTLLVESGFIYRPTKPTPTAYDAEQVGIATDPTTSWWSIGVGDPPRDPNDPTTVTTIKESLSVNTGCVGTLLSPIPELYGLARRQALVIYVSMFEPTFPLPHSGHQLLIGNEQFEVMDSFRLPNNRLEILLSKRADYDTAPRAHAAGTPVIFWHRMAHFDNKWDGTPYTIIARSSTGVEGRHTVSPPTPVNRAVRPPCPTSISLNNNRDQRQVIYGDISVAWSIRSREGNNGIADTNLRTYVEIWHNGTRATFRQALFGSNTVVFRNMQSFSFSASDISSAIGSTAGQLEIRLYTTAASDTVKSWQTAIYYVDWRASGTCTGWNCDWGNNWGGRRAGGFGIDFGENYSQGA